MKILKSHLQFVANQAIEVWLWYQALIAYLYYPDTGRSADIFWLYIVTVLATLVAMAVVVTPNSKTLFQKILGHSVTFKHAVYIFGVLILSVSFVGWIFWTAHNLGVLTDFIPSISLGSIIVILLYKIGVQYIDNKQTDSGNKRVKKAVRLALQMGSLLIAFIIYAYIVEYMGEIPIQSIFVIIVIPILVLFEYSLVMYEARGGKYAPRTTS